MAEIVGCWMTCWALTVMAIVCRPDREIYLKRLVRFTIVTLFLWPVILFESIRKVQL